MRNKLKKSFFRSMLPALLVAISPLPALADNATLYMGSSSAAFVIKGSDNSSNLVVYDNGTAIFQGAVYANGNTLLGAASGGGGSSSYAGFDNGSLQTANATASGSNSTAMGYLTTASGYYSTASGYRTTASGTLSTASGYGTTASGDYSTAMGDSTTASGYGSTAMGRSTTANGYYSTAMGRSTTASGDYSTAMGYDTDADCFAQTTIGQFSDNSSFNCDPTSAASDDDSPLFVIGNGSGTGSRSNALVVYDNGTAIFQGSVYADNGSTLLGAASGGSSSSYQGTGGAGSFQTPNATASGANSTAMGYFTNASGANSTAMGRGTNASGYASTAMGRDTTADCYAQTTIGQYSNSSWANCNTSYSASQNGSPLFVIGNGTSSGASDALVVYDSGDAVFDGGVVANGVALSSDRRLKQNIVTLAGSLEKVQQLRGVSYEWIDPNRRGGRQIGFIAQEVQEVIPEVVVQNGDYLTMSYSNLTAVLVEAVKEQQLEIEQNDRENEALEAENAALRGRLESIEAVLRNAGLLK